MGEVGPVGRPRAAGRSPGHHRRQSVGRQWLRATFDGPDCAPRYPNDRTREIIWMLSCTSGRAIDCGGQELLENEIAAAPKPIVGRASTVRVLFSDLHGVARGKDVPVREFDRVADQ